MLLQANVPETGPPSRPDDPPLLPGEKVQGVAREVTYLCPYSGPARGVLSVTNYRLHFRSMDRDTPYVVDVPLGVVSRIFCGKFCICLPWHALCGWRLLGVIAIRSGMCFMQRLTLYFICFGWGSSVMIVTIYFASWKCR